MSYETPILTAGGASNQSIREAVTTPRHDVGTRAQTSDGRVFYYARSKNTNADAANTLSAGQFCQMAAQDADFTNAAVASAAAVGATSVSVTLGGTNSVPLNDYQGGYLCVNDAAGEGRVYRISGNAATGTEAGGSATTAFTVDLSDEIETALTTSSEATLLKNPWMDITEAAAGHAHFVCGVPQFEVPAGNTNAQYFWLQTWGVSCGEDDASTAVGAALESGDTAAQAQIGNGEAAQIGVQLITGVAGEFRPKFLTIAP